jgi:amidase
MCVEQILNAGASCIGKTISDELTCSLDGESYFYGTPTNPNSPDRIPGGSSSGSASAVACGLVDFAIGTDSAGSTRVPASHCGILGMRPTIHRISESGILPFAPSSSTVGIFTSNLTILEKVMSVLLASNDIAQRSINTIYLLEDAFSIADQEVDAAIRDYISQLVDTTNIKISSITLGDIVGEKTNLTFLQENVFGIVQCVEIWNAVGAWIEESQPEMGPRIQDAMDHFKQLVVIASASIN